MAKSPWRCVTFAAFYLNASRPAKWKKHKSHKTAAFSRARTGTITLFYDFCDFCDFSLLARNALGRSHKTQKSPGANCTNSTNGKESTDETDEVVPFSQKSLRRLEKGGRPTVQFEIHPDVLASRNDVFENVLYYIC
jgi:hypothetical protein